MILYGNVFTQLFHSPWHHNPCRHLPRNCSFTQPISPSPSKRPPRPPLPSPPKPPPAPSSSSASPATPSSNPPRSRSSSRASIVFLSLASPAPPSSARQKLPRREKLQPAEKHSCRSSSFQVATHSSRSSTEGDFPFSIPPPAEKLLTIPPPAPKLQAIPPPAAHLPPPVVDPFQQYGRLKDTTNVMVEEQIAIFLKTIGHANDFHNLAERFQHSTATISKYFNLVLKVVVKLENRVIVPPNLEAAPERIIYSKHDPYFKDCIGAIDGVHIDIVVPSGEQIPYRGWKTRTISI
ncbi:unnamed protein product [Linum tenue]|uniref:DUF8040 domain-containing protein n=1 Tax=Linum tenue TaxID=586396 RepID=A0AAV0LC80_9ROSI|nr:unnamed protein product [Linum tenue]